MFDQLFIDNVLGANFSIYDFTDKKRATTNHILYMIARCASMFEWKNLPETIPQRNLELYLQINGNVCFYKHDGKLYAFRGGMGGEPDVYYMPTIYTIANPALNLSAQPRIDIDCVVIPNDTMYIGLFPLFSRYATMMTENEISMRLALVNSRIQDLISASDDTTAESAKKFLSDVEAGKTGIIADKEMFEREKSLFTSPYGTTGTHVITDIIEQMQYTKASFFNEIGLNANYNMKRESLNTSESQMNNDALLPLVDDMLKQRQIGAEKVNKMFGTEISVDFASSWEDNEEEIEIEHDEMKEENDPSTDTEENTESGVENENG